MSVIPDRAAPPDTPPGASACLVTRNSAEEGTAVQDSTVLQNGGQPNTGPRSPGPENTGQDAAMQTTGQDAAVRITEVSKTFGRGPSTVVALDRVSLSVAPGEFVCLIGASGCGKSTLLSLVAGLDRPTSGGISTNGNRVALMFQEPALFPWLTAARNIELALRATGVSRAARRDREDEPFGALDAMTRDLLHEVLEGLWRRRGLSVLFVTHEVREAVRLGDRVVLL